MSNIQILGIVICIVGIAMFVLSFFLERRIVRITLGILGAVLTFASCALFLWNMGNMKYVTYSIFAVSLVLTIRDVFKHSPAQ